MKKQLTTIYFLLLFAFSLHFALDAQTTITLQPDAAAGKDALLHGLSSQVNTNFDDNAQLAANAWTFGGTPGVVRSVFAFDLSTIPNGAVVESAFLSLYAYDVDNGFGRHSTRSGSNSCLLQRVTSPWDESTVTWTNQPTSTTENEVVLQMSTSTDQNYLDINVANLVKDMIDNPSTSHGFLLKLQQESFYRLLNFASSDHINSALRPKLVVTFNTIAPAICEVEVTPKGIVFPRMSTAQRNSITAKQGQCIYNTDLEAIDCYTGSEWKVNCCTMDNLSSTNIDETQAILMEENDVLRAQLSYLEADLQDLKKLVAQLAEKKDLPIQSVTLQDQELLKQNSPNPFNGTTKIEYYVPPTSKSARIKIFDISGQLLKSIPIHVHGNGAIELSMDNYSNQIYHYSLEIDGNIVSTKKMNSIK